jgi:hypothetical protein
MHEFLAALTSIILFIGLVPYLRDILRGKTKPERASWFIWGVLGGIAFFSQLAEGASWSLILPAFDSLIGLIIFFFAILYGVGGFTKRDITSLSLAGLGLVAWYLTNQPLTALMIVIGIDAIGAYLTIVKTYEQPETETMFSWLMASLAGIPTLITIDHWYFDLIIYPIYIVIINSAVPLAIYLGRRKVSI